MNRILYLIFLCFLAVACASKSDSSKIERAKNSQSRMDAAVQELDNGGQSVLGQTGQSSASGESYSRANEQADSAFRELDCAISGGMKCFVASSEPNVPVQKVPEVQEPLKDSIPNKARPGNVAVKERAHIQTKYPVVNGVPVWFAQPNYDGYIGGVGVAKANQDAYEQKRIATALAQADLASGVKVSVDNELTIEKYQVDTKTQKYYREIFTNMSRQQAAEYINSPVLMDEWYNELTGELYVWVVLP